MEKLTYVLWKQAAVTIDQFRQQLLGHSARRLSDLGARGLSVILADERAVPGLRMSRLDPTAVVSVWLDTALNRGPCEQVLASQTSRLAGYLTLESVPIVNTQHVAPLGERVPGLYTVAFLEKPDSLAYAEWLERWQGFHTRVAIETQSTFLYVQNVLIRPVTNDAPPWVAIVEEAFPAAAATDPMVFYAADTAEQLAEHQRRMMESCERFIDFSRLETHPMSAYVVKRAWD
ncbi:MAG: EthD domain-containing protein [Deltaproteobacteria bacterium]|nr:EthD domain-containing protein [Deltaproteobacteria bacterium]